MTRATGVVQGDNAIRVEQGCNIGVVEWNFFQGIAGSAVYFSLPTDGIWFTDSSGGFQVRSTYQWTIVWNVMEDVGATHNRAPVYVNGTQCTAACLDQLHVVHNAFFNSQPLDNHIYIDLAPNVGGDYAFIDNVFYMATVAPNSTTTSFVRNVHYSVYNATERGPAPEFFYGPVGTGTVALSNCTSCVPGPSSDWIGYQIQMHGNTYAAPAGANVAYFVDDGLNAINATRWPAARSLADLRSLFGYENYPIGTDAGVEFALDPKIVARLGLLGRPRDSADPSTGAHTCLV